MCSSDLLVESNVPPVVSLVRLAPAGGPIPNGTAFTIGVSATDDVAVTNVAIVGVGGVTFTTNVPDGSTRTFSIPVPETVPAGTAIRILAQATDSIGQRSDGQSIELITSDGTAPRVAIAAPAANVLLDPSAPLTLAVASSDNGGNHRLEVALDGPLILSTHVEVAAQPDVTLTNLVLFPLGGAVLDGRPLLATVRGVDAAGNSRIVSRSYRLPDRVPPVVVSVSPTNGASGVALMPDIRAVFSEPLDTNTVSSTTLLLLRGNEDAPVEAALEVSADLTSVKVVPGAPLAPATR